MSRCLSKIDCRPVTAFSVHFLHIKKLTLLYQLAKIEYQTIFASQFIKQYVVNVMNFRVILSQVLL